MYYTWLLVIISMFCLLFCTYSLCFTNSSLQQLAEAASFIHHHNTLTSRLLTFLSAPSNYYRLMIVPLIPPGVIDHNAKLVVKMAVGLKTTFGQGESDPSFVISDGHRFVGMITLDKNNYPSSAPCLGMEGHSGKIMTRHTDAGLPKPSESYYPGRFEIRCQTICLLHLFSPYLRPRF